MTDAQASQPIRQLPTSLVNRIAAGEVIERPASVVKELVENALDAGARRIAVEVEDGGRELMRVIDDGGGIPADQLSLAFTEHATSKLRNDDDLFRIATMGFRGEALASIGAVSQARILSRASGSATACEIFNRGGEISGVQAAAGNAGSTVEVRNLFFNTPARRKFMRGAATEFGHISDAMLRLALPYPDVHFSLKHNGRNSLDLPPNTPDQRWLAAWPEEFREHRLTIDAGDVELRLRGIVGLPELARPTPKYQFLYLNGRHIRDKFILHAAREAYRGLTEPGRYPAAILLLEIPPQDVDVNVHPTKVEVRFRDSGRVHGLVLASIREKLLGSDLTPAATPMRGSSDEPARIELREKLAAFFRQAPPEALVPGAAAPWAPQPPPNPLQLYAPDTQLPLSGRFEAERDFSSSSPRVSAPNDDRAQSPAPQATGPASPAAHDPFSSGAPAIQLHNSYLVAQTSDGMIIIDQHALHERIMYEELRHRLLKGPLESQRLLIPHAFAATERQMALLEQIQPLLRRLGIELSSFGPDTMAVHAFPTFLEKLDPASFVRELLERGEQELLDLHEEELLHEVLDMMACKAAVKAGDPLTTGEIEALLARRDLVERSSNCPHGRPTTLRLTLKELEKQFKRTGF